MKFAMNAASLMLMVSVCLPVCAQQQQQATTGQQTKSNRSANSTTQNKSSKTKNEVLGVVGGPVVQYEKLAKAPTELPAMPAYEPAGSKCNLGMKRTVNGVTELLLYIDTPYDGATAKQYYAGQFQQPGWKTTYNRGNSMSAVFNGNVCQVTVIPGTANKSRVMLNYQFRNTQ